MKAKNICPRCHQKSARGLVQLSRADNKTLICAACGDEENAIWMPLATAAIQGAPITEQDATRAFAHLLPN